MARQHSIEDELGSLDSLPPPDKASQLVDLPTVAVKKPKKAKKKFHIFHRNSHSLRKEKKSSANNVFLSSSYPASLHLPDDSGRHSPSNASISAESGQSEISGGTASDEDFVEALVHPKGRSPTPMQHLTIPDPVVRWMEFC